MEEATKRYMLTGDHWTAEESYRMGITQQIAPTPEEALDAAVVIARKIAACDNGALASGGSVAVCGTQ